MKEKELRKAINMRDSKSLNKFGERIEWVRKSLGLTKQKVASDLGMPIASYHGRENGVRTVNSDEFLVMAEYFNAKWKPLEWNGKTIKTITPQFLMWGLHD